MNIQLPERAVIVETGIVSDTCVEILSGLEEGQIVEVAGTRASSNFNQNFVMMPGPMGGGPVGRPDAGTTMTVTRN
jgi:HlyD family secretion protein